MLLIDRKTDSPTLHCDGCGASIDAGDEAEARWLSDPSAPDSIFFLHDECVKTFEAESGEPTLGTDLGHALRRLAAVPA